VLPSPTIFTLVGRNAQRIEEVSAHLETLGNETHIHIVKNSDEIEGAWNKIHAERPVDILLVAQGMLPESAEGSTYEDIKETFEANTIGPITWCQCAARDMGKELSGRGVTTGHTPRITLGTNTIPHGSAYLRKGTIAVIGSVAGDRGRVKNHTYSAAKSAIETYCHGLRLRLLPHVTVTLIKPGITKTAMTRQLPSSPLKFSASQVAKPAVAAIVAGKKSVYCPPIWGFIMTLIKLLPDSVLKKTGI
jgi:short-subunit dehydrogenase